MLLHSSRSPAAKLQLLAAVLLLFVVLNMLRGPQIVVDRITWYTEDTFNAGTPQRGPFLLHFTAAM